jgi:hypothetical protein
VTPIVVETDAPPSSISFRLTRGRVRPPLRAAPGMGRAPDRGGSACRRGPGARCVRQLHPEPAQSRHHPESGWVSLHLTPSSPPRQRAPRQASRECTSAAGRIRLRPRCAPDGLRRSSARGTDDHLPLRLRSPTVVQGCQRPHLPVLHGYALAEIAIVLRLPPRAVDTLLSVARREVRAWMDNPRPLDALGRPDASVPRILAFAQPDAFVGEVQCAIFESVHGACHSSSEIEQLYEPSAPSLDADTLAHIVSCRTCLDRLPGIGLLSAAERSMPDGVRGKARSPEHRRFSHRLLHVSRRFLGYNSFLAKLNATGTALIFSSYLGGGTHDDRTTGVAINAAGYAYLAGHSMALDFPVIHPALQPSRRSNQWDAVVVRVALGNPPGFSIEGLTPRRGGNAGSVTLRIIGTGFQAETTARLACGDQPLLESSQPFVEEGGRALEAWFDLRRTAPSTCDVTVRNLGGTESTQRGAFVVEEGGGARLSLNVLGPSAVRPSCPRPLPSFSRTTARAIRVSFRFRLGFQHRVPPFDRSPLLQQRHYQAASCKNSIDRTRRSECHLDTQL